MKVTGKKEPLLNFLRELCCEMLTVHGTPLKNPKRVIGCEVRYDRLDHLIVAIPVDEKGKQPRRNCKKCSEEGKKDAKCVFLCEKCQIPLHVQCFKEFILFA